MAELGDNDLFGEMALIDSELRSADATALEETHLYTISRDTFNYDLEQTPPSVRLIMKVVLNNFRDVRDKWLNRQTENSSSELAKGERELILDFEKLRVSSRLHYETMIDKAISENQFFLDFQPIYSLDEDYIKGFEALVRWQHPEKGYLLPDTFIPFTESTGQIITLGYQIIGMACQALEEMQKNYPMDLTMSINLSFRQLEEEGAVEKIIHTISSFNIDISQIKLEITENYLTQDPEKVREQLEQLKSSGLKIIIDDFGTGHASLSYLTQFPIDGIKIDRSFINKMLQDEYSLEIVKATNEIGRNLGLIVVAEGAETIEEIELLKQINCDTIQGYWFAKPLSLSGAITLLKS